MTGSFAKSLSNWCYDLIQFLSTHSEHWMDLQRFLSPSRFELWHLYTQICWLLSLLHTFAHKYTYIVVFIAHLCLSIYSLLSSWHTFTHKSTDCCLSSTPLLTIPLIVVFTAYLCSQISISSFVVLHSTTYCFTNQPIVPCTPLLPSAPLIVLSVALHASPLTSVSLCHTHRLYLPTTAITPRPNTPWRCAVWLITLPIYTQAASCPPSPAPPPPPRSPPLFPAPGLKHPRCKLFVTPCAWLRAT